MAIYFSAGVLATTAQAHCLHLSNRKTQSMLPPKLTRIVLAISLVAWSVALTIVWHVAAAVAFPFIVLGIIVGCRFITSTSSLDDDISYALYNVSKYPTDTFTLLTAPPGLVIMRQCFAHLLEAFRMIGFLDTIKGTVSDTAKQMTHLSIVYFAR